MAAKNVDEELISLQLDKPVPRVRSEDQLQAHTVDAQFEQKPIERSLLLLRKGDDVQRLSVIQSVPQLLQYDTNGCITRVVPKIQQELPKASSEFHVACSKTFRALIEKKLPINLLPTFIEGCKSKDPIISNAWTEALIEVIPNLPVDQVKNDVMNLALMKAQGSNPMFFRIASCKMIGKISVHSKLDALYVKSTVLPIVQSLCQDNVTEVRVEICANLHFVAQGLGETLVKNCLLPNIVELACDDKMQVRSAAITTVVLVLPFLNKQTQLDTIVPLLKQLFVKSSAPSDITFITISSVYGQVLDKLGKDLDSSTSIWFLQFFKTLARKGYPMNQQLDFNPNIAVECRDNCANNLTSVTNFVKNWVPDQLDIWNLIVNDLVNDSCYIVRRSVASHIAEITKVLGDQCSYMKPYIVKILRDDAEEVLEALVGQVAKILSYLNEHHILSKDVTPQYALDITRALLKCKIELSKTYNWRVNAIFFAQLEYLPKCMPSDFIHQHFTPVLFKSIFESRAHPVKYQAIRTMLIFLRYNGKEIQRKWIRDNLIVGLCYSKNCFTRTSFVKLCSYALEIFSYNYFKKFFFEHIIKLGEDPILNVRYCIIELLPQLQDTIILPEDKKLQTMLDNLIAKLEMSEKSKDAKLLLKNKLKEIKQGGYKKRDGGEEKFKLDEEMAIFQMKISSPPSSITTHAPSNLAETRKDNVQISITQPRKGSSTTSRPPTSRSNSRSSRQNRTDLGFLDQNFFIDAGIDLPNNVDINNTRISHLLSTDMCEKLIVTDLKIKMDNVNNDFHQLELSSNITDDVKVKMRRVKTSKLKMSSNKTNNLMPQTSDLKNKRHSSVILAPTKDMKKSFNRRSLNMAGGDYSKIPISLKKSKSHEVVKKTEKKQTNLKDNSCQSDNCSNQIKINDFELTNRLKYSHQDLHLDNIQAINNDNKLFVPIKNSIRNVKGSGLPVLKKK